ncbi:ubiquitin family protein [Nocardia carnea]|uniref:STAS domain-containing protein n=1 Tax=Nocardia carnea TaxID=37328 RepID=A0ABW7TTH4_9NOCA|nr:hypothetical protein [Nocardia carnea]
MTRNHIEPTAAGFRLIDAADRSIDLRWSDIETVSAYAVDAITSVLKYLDFTLMNGSVITVDDRTGGWRSVLEAVSKHLDLRVTDLAAAIDSLTPDGDIQTLATARR